VFNPATLEAGSVLPPFADWPFMTSHKLSSFQRRALSAVLASATMLGGTGLVGNAYAAADTSIATAAVIVPITIVKGTVLSFGKFARGATTGSVTVSAAGVRSAADGPSLVATGPAVTAATFAVGGEASTTYSVDVAADANLANTTTVGAGATLNMALTGLNWTVSSEGAAISPVTGTLTALGAGSISVGGTLAVDATQIPGAYVGNVTATVLYN
jgi:hypothetical protein